MNHYQSPLGTIHIAADSQMNLCGLWFADQKHYGSTLSTDVRIVDISRMPQVKAWLDEYFSGRQPGFTPPISLHTSQFAASVLAQLQTIPYSATTTYGAIARTLNTSPRAVATAVARNPVSLIIPCHRVVGADGKLTGYAGGLDRKRYLLRLEAILRH